MDNSKDFTCLILEPVVLIAEDLCLMIKDEMPNARVVVVATPDEAVEALVNERVDIAFLNLPPTKLKGSDLGDALAAMHAVPVFLGYEAEARRSRDLYLEQPFLGEAVVAELRRVQQGKTRPATSSDDQMAM